MITIIDYGLGNLGSLLNMLKRLGVAALISAKPTDIARAEKLILPGVGAFDSAMANLKRLGLIALLNQKIIGGKTPLLGICLGMQLFSHESEEGRLKGLGWLRAKTVKFKFSEPASRLKIPHMGWNTIEPQQKDKLFQGLRSEIRFYFAHSYHLVCADKRDVLATTSYGYDFVSCCKNDNIIGVQFHPEKSHRFGMALLANFAKSY